MRDQQTLIYQLQDRVNELEYELSKKRRALIDIEVLLEKESVDRFAIECRKVIREAQ
jgi:hypothetical protein